jgi:hypothetical protein
MAAIDISESLSETHKGGSHGPGKALKFWWTGFRHARAEALTLRRLQAMTAYELADLGFDPEAVYAAAPSAFRSLRRDTSGVAA